jgi:hypothetical protein
MTTTISGTTGITYPDNTNQTTAYLMWIPLATCSYTFSDAPTFQFLLPNDANLYLSLGSKIQLTQSATVKYFIVTAIGAYSGSTTLITVYGGTDYTLTNNTITAASYSNMKSPLGFPLNPEKWTVLFMDTTTTWGTGGTTANAWYYLLNSVPAAAGLLVPVGMWVISYTIPMYIAATAGTATYALVTLTTSATELDKKYTTVVYNSSNANLATLTNGNHVITQTVKTWWYFMVSSLFSGCTALQAGYTRGSVEIRALCAYL